jgi:hypothetical protein
MKNLESILGNDEYLEEGKSFIRLFNEYKTHGSLCIGFDFDGTVYDYHGSGASYERVRQLLRNLKSIGCKLVCWTAHSDLKFVEEFCINNNIPCDDINSGGITLDWNSVKPFFSALLDDRAGLPHVYSDLKLLYDTVKYEELQK